MPYLSHSQTETWTQCRRRWFLTKVEGAPQAPSTALILGTAVHAAIEADGRRIIVMGYPSVPVDVLYNDFAGALQETLRSDDPHQLITDAERLDMLAKGHAILEAYVTHLQPRYAPLSVEESFTVDIHGAPGWRFTGRIDARARMSDGTLAIMDFKTGKAWDRGLEHGKPQASAYLMADSERTPLAQAHAVVFVVFPVTPDGNGGYVSRPQFRVTTRTAGQIDAYAAGLVRTTQDITAARKSGEFPASTGPLCGWCGVLGSCAAGQSWLASHGRKPAIPVVSARREDAS